MLVKTLNNIKLSVTCPLWQTLYMGPSSEKKSVKTKSLIYYLSAWSAYNIAFQVLAIRSSKVKILDTLIITDVCNIIDGWCMPSLLFLSCKYTWWDVIVMHSYIDNHQNFNVSETANFLGVKLFSQIYHTKRKYRKRPFLFFWWSLTFFHVRCLPRWNCLQVRWSWQSSFTANNKVSYQYIPKFRFLFAPTYFNQY